MKFRAFIAGLPVLAGCIDFSAAETAFCDNAAPGHRVVACEDRLGQEPAALLIVGLPPSIDVGTCSGTIRVQAMDSLGNKAVARAETIVGLSATPAVGANFYGDEACTVPVSAPASTVTLLAGSNDVLFAFKSSTVGMLRINASAQGLTNGAGELEIARGNGSGLAFLTAPQTTIAGACSAAVAIQFQKGDGSPVQFSSDTSVGLNGDTTSGMSFFGSSGCSGAPITSLTVGAGQSTATFYYKMTMAGSHALTVSAAGLVSASQMETANAGPAAKLAVTTALPSLGAGMCSGVVVVQAQDTYGNAAGVASTTLLSLAASSSIGFNFFSEFTCTSRITQTAIQPGSSSASFYFMGTKAGDITISVTATGLGTETLAQTINPGPATKLDLATAAITLTAGTCSAALTIRSLDAYDNISSVTGGTPVSLSSSLSGLAFYTISGCTVATTGTTIAAGQSSTIFYIRSTKAQALGAITVAASGFASDFADVIIRPSSPAQIRFTSAAQTVPIGYVSGEATFEIQDAYGNSSPLDSTTGVEVTVVNPSLSYDYYCTGPDTSTCSRPSCCSCSCGCSCTGAYVYVSGGQSSGSFWFKESHNTTPPSNPTTTTLTILVTLPNVGLAGDFQYATITP